MQNTSPPALRKYKIGLAALGVLTLVLFVFVLIQGQSAKADTKTYDEAQKAATALETYTSTKGTIPESLSAAGDTSAPSSVQYTKVSDSSYKLCVTYKAASGFSSSDVTSRVLSGAYGASYPPATNSDTTTSYLYISPDHKKGQNCQTVKPYLYGGYNSYYGGSSSTSSTDPYTLCDNQYAKDKNNTAYTACLDKADSSSSSTSTTPSSSSSSSSTQDLYTKCNAMYPNASQDKEYYACIGSSSPATSANIRRRLN